MAAQEVKQLHMKVASRVNELMKAIPKLNFFIQETDFASKILRLVKKKKIS